MSTPYRLFLLPCLVLLLSLSACDSQEDPVLYPSGQWSGDVAVSPPLREGETCGGRPYNTLELSLDIPQPIEDPVQRPGTFTLHTGAENTFCESISGLLNLVEIDGNQVTITMEGDRRYEGTLSNRGATMAGTLTIPGRTIPNLVLRLTAFPE